MHVRDTNFRGQICAALCQVYCTIREALQGCLRFKRIDFLKVWLGYQQSLQPLHMGLSLNVDLAATAFLEQQPVVTFLVRPGIR